MIRTLPDIASHHRLSRIMQMKYLTERAIDTFALLVVAASSRRSSTRSCRVKFFCLFLAAVS